MISCGWKASPSLIWSSISHQPIFPDLRSVVHQSDILVREKVNQERWQPKVGLVTDLIEDQSDDVAACLNQSLMIDRRSRLVLHFPNPLTEGHISNQ